MSISSLNDIKKGKILDIDNQPCLVIEATFLRMQQRKPVMNTKLRNLISGKNLEVTFHSGEKVDEADLSHQKASFLYDDDSNAYFMNSESYEQFDIDKERLADQMGFLKEGTEVDALYYNGVAVAVEIPRKVELKVVTTVEGVRGDTAQGKVTKPATLETGVDINVPLFIKQGDIIRINTETSEYLERV